MPSPVTPTIGTFSFVSLEGPPSPGGLELKDITRQGADGVALLQNAKRFLPFQMTSFVDADDATAVLVLLRAYAAIRGTLVSVTDALGNVHGDVAVLQVQPTRQKKVEGAVGGLSTSKGYIVEAVWTLQLTKDDSAEE